MKLMTTPARLTKVFENILLYDGNATLENVVLTVDEKGLTAFAVYQDAVIINVEIAKSYFDSFDATIGEKVSITATLLNKLKKQFVGEEFVILTIEESKIKLTNKGKDKEGTKRYTEDLQIPEEPAFKLPLIDDPEKGRIPATVNKSSLIAKINNNSLNKLPNSEDYRFIVEANKFCIISKDNVGVFELDIDMVKAEKTENFDLRFGGDLFRKIINQFQGDIWLMVSAQKSEKEEPGALITQNSPDLALTYAQSALRR